tara:strand:- start:491 stop:760 length:270 start_codon:yes stop_codon:yes gene_type:complete
MRPTLLKTQIDQRRAFRKMMVSTRNVSRTQFLSQVGNNNKMPILLIARGGGLNSIAHNIFQSFRSDQATIKIPGKTPGSLIYQEFLEPL